MMVRGIVVGHLVPCRGTRGDDKCSRRNHVRLEATEITFRPDAYISASRERGNLIARTRHVFPRRGLCWLVSTDCFSHYIRDVAREFDGANCDHIFRRAGRGQTSRIAAQTRIASAAVVACGENIKHRLRSSPARQRITHRRIVARRCEAVCAAAHVCPTVVGDQRVRQHGGFLQCRIRQRTKSAADGLHKQLRSRSHATEMSVGGDIDRAARVRDRGKSRPTARDDSRDVCAVTVAVHKTGREVCEDPPREIGMQLIHARVIDAHQNIRAGQSKIICRHQRIRRHTEADAAKIICAGAGLCGFQQLHARPCRRGRPIQSRINRDHSAKWRGIFRQRVPTHRAELRSDSRIRICEHEYIQLGARRQRFLFKREWQQFHFQFVHWLIRQYRLRLWIGGKAACRRSISADEEGVVWNVRNNRHSRISQCTAECSVHRAA